MIGGGTSESETLAAFAAISSHSAKATAGALVLLLAWETASPYFAFFRRRWKERLGHALVNFLFGVVNALIVAFLFTGLWAIAVRFAAEHGFGILHWLELPGWAAAMVAILALDFWTYWWHRMNHRIPFLWRFHRVHHSDPRMDVTTANRFHFGEIILSSILRVPVILLVGAELWHIALYAALLNPVVQFHHANIGIPNRLDRILRWVIPTPNMHKVHHSTYQPETDSNFTSLLAVWDRVFGTFRGRQEFGEESGFRLGLKEFEGAGNQSLGALLRAHHGRRSENNSRDREGGA